MIDGKEATRVDRARPRHKLFQPAALDMAGEQRRAHLLDLSQTGALVNVAVPPEEGSFVYLSCGELRRSARVAWTRGTRLGITFVLPLTAAEVDAIVTLGASARVLQE